MRQTRYMRAAPWHSFWIYNHENETAYWRCCFCRCILFSRHKNRTENAWIVTDAERQNNCMGGFYYRYYCAYRCGLSSPQRRRKGASWMSDSKLVVLFLWIIVIELAIGVYVLIQVALGLQQTGSQISASVTAAQSSPIGKLLGAFFGKLTGV